MKPIIGITASYLDAKYYLFSTYACAISAAGGIPIIIPFSDDVEALEKTVDLCDAILFSGGNDIDPSYYGEKIINGTVIIAEGRDSFEIKLFDIVKKTKKPIMAICRGMQLINVAMGGSLYQDLPAQYESNICHSQKEPKTEPSHSVNTVSGTPLHKLTECVRLTANSFHHQAVKRLGEGLIPMAYADDGIPEAYYGEGEQYLRAYQWHPERLYSKDKANLSLFKDFINAASGNEYEK